MSPEAAKPVEATSQDTYFLDRVDAARRQLARTGNQDDFNAEIDSLIAGALTKAELGELGDYSADELRQRLEGVGRALLDNGHARFDSKFMKNEITRTGGLRQALLNLGPDGEAALKRFALSAERESAVEDLSHIEEKKSVGVEAVREAVNIDPAVVESANLAELTEKQKEFDELSDDDKMLINRRKRYIQQRQESIRNQDFSDAGTLKQYIYETEKELSHEAKKYLGW